MTVSEAISEIDRQIDFLLLSRAIFPPIQPEAVGKRAFATGKYFKERGYDVTCTFSEPITEAKRERMNAIGHWINQNFIVRLFSIVESTGIFTENAKINQSLPGWEELDMVRRLRNKFGHSSGFCDANKPDHRKLRARLVEKFSLRDGDHLPHLFPIPVDHVVVPLAEGCKVYLRGSGI